MAPWIAKAIVLATSVAMLVVPHLAHRRNRVEREVVRSRKGARERLLLAVVSFGFLLPLVWVMTPAPAFADRSSHLPSQVAGLALYSAGLWLLYRSHADLGANWSITLDIRREHELVAHGVYRRIRHPMYAALLLYGAGQALVVPNWIAGPAYLVAVACLVALRLAPEERMMREEFGGQYDAYRARTKRIVPLVW